MIGKIYEVFVDGKSVRLVGSTVRPLKVRRINGYTKRFGPTVELRLVREVPRPNGYSDRDFDFYLKACEALDIARKKTYREQGGLNLLSPLLQALWCPQTQSELGKLGSREAKAKAGSKGGKIGGRLNGRKHCLDMMERKIGIFGMSKEQRKEASSRGGIKSSANGRLQQITTPESRKLAYKNGIGKMTSEERTTQGQDAVKGLLAKRKSGNAYESLCVRWNMQRGKDCNCGHHMVTPC